MKPPIKSDTERGAVDQPRLVSPWEDISSHSRDSKDRTPRTWRRKIGVFTIRLSRHIHYPPDVWLATCDGVFPQQPMKSKDVREAACQAVAKLQVAIEEARDEILGANDQVEARDE